MHVGYLYNLEVKRKNLFKPISPFAYFLTSGNLSFRKTCLEIRGIVWCER